MADKIIASDVIESGKIVEEIGKVENALVGLLGQMKAITVESGRFSTQAQGNTTLQTRINLESKAGALIKERARLENALIKTQAKRTQAGRLVNQRLQEERIAVNALNREAKEAAILNSKYIGAYQKLNLQRSQASKTLRDLVASEKASNEEIEKAQANFDKLDAKVKKADDAVRDSTKNVGNYKSAFAGVKDVLTGLVGAFGIVEGLRLGIQFAKDSAALARQAKSVEYAFEQLGNEGENAFNKVRKATRGALSDLSIKTSINEFAQFGLSLEEIDTLFEFLAVSAAQTGKSVDELKSSLVEGLSKESKLRIDNLGISASELNDELSKTPDFVNAVANIAKTKLADAGDILDKAGNGAETWAAALENLQVELGKTVNTFPVFSSFSIVLNSIGYQFSQINFALSSNLSWFEKIAVVTRTATFQGKETNARLIAEYNNRERVSESIREQAKEYEKLYGSIAPLKEQQKALFEGFDLSGPVRNVNFLNTSISNLNDKLEEVSNRDEAIAIQNTIAALEKERDAILGNKNAIDTSVNTINGSINAYQELIAELTELRDGTATTTSEYKKFDDQIAQTERKIKQLKEGVDSLTEIETVSFNFTVGATDNPDAPNILEIEQGLTNQIIANKEREAAILKTIEDGRLADYKGFTKEERDILQDSLDVKKDLQRDAEYAIQDLVIGSLDTIFQARIDNIDKQLTANQDYLDTVLNDEAKSDEQKEAAQIAFDKKQEELLIQKDKRERQGFLVQQGLALAQIAIEAAKGIATANAMAPITFGASLSWIPSIITTAAAQAGLVLAQSIPQFYKGTENAPEGWAWTDEKGAEIHTDKHGNIKDYGSDGGARLKWLESGDKIFTATKTKEVLNNTIYKGHEERVAYKEKSSMPDNRLYSEVSQLRREMARYANKPNNFNVTAVVKQPITKY